MVNIKEERSRGVSEAEPYDAAGSAQFEQQSQQPDSHRPSQTHRHPSQPSSSPPSKRSISQFGLDGSVGEEMPTETRSSSKAANPAPKPAASKSTKKGKATVVKVPRRGGGGSKKSKSSKSKKAAPARRGSAAGTGADGDDIVPDEEENGDDGDESDDGSDSGPYCICRGPDNHKFMIFCESCEDWFHGECVKMDKYTGENLVQRYICPNCTTDRDFTRYKKTCALEGCQVVARLYDVPKEKESKFCSDEHTQKWWEKLIATLPKQKTGGADQLTQGEFMGLLGKGNGNEAKHDEKNGDGWKLGDEPFGKSYVLPPFLRDRSANRSNPGIPPDFWEKHPASQVFTDEETSLLATSADSRRELGEEIFLSRKMLTILDLAIKNRETLVQSSVWPTIAKDFCGYDYRLDSIGAPAPFAAFISPGQVGEKILDTGKLDLPDVKNNMEALAGLMCTKKKCKPHAGWTGILRKMVNHQIKELAAQAKEKLDYEARIRDCAAVRYRRKQKEHHSVEVVGGLEEPSIED